MGEARTARNPRSCKPWAGICTSLLKNDRRTKEDSTIKTVGQTKAKNTVITIESGRTKERDVGVDRGVGISVAAVILLQTAASSRGKGKPWRRRRGRRWWSRRNETEMRNDCPWSHPMSNIRLRMSPLRLDHHARHRRPPLRALRSHPGSKEINHMRIRHLPVHWKT